MGDNYQCNYQKINDDLDNLNCQKIYQSLHSFVELNQQTVRQIQFIAAASEFLCILANNNIISCYGNDTFNPIPSNIQNLNQSPIVYDLVAGYNNICMYFLNNSLLRNLECWGSDRTLINHIPHFIKSRIEQGNIIDISIGNDTACLIHEFKLMCWGSCLIDSGNLCRTTKQFTQANQVSVGYDHACKTIYQYSARKMYQMNDYYVSYGHIECWGNNTHGQLDIPFDFKSDSIVTGTAGNGITCVIRMNMRAGCWGKFSLEFFKSNNYEYGVRTGGRHTCNVLAGRYECYGNNEYGQLELGMNNKFESAFSLSAGWDYTCYLGEYHTDIYSLNCQGFNFIGQIDIPPILSMYRKIVMIKSGIAHSCAVRSDETDIICWGGHNEHQELDIDNLKFSFSSVEVGHGFTCGVYHLITGDDGLVCVGLNDQGQLDHPVVHSMIVQLRLGGVHGCLLHSVNLMNELLCWGSDLYGQASIPTNLRRWVYEVALADAYSCVVMIEVELAVHCWGSWTPDLSRVRWHGLVACYENLCGIDQDFKSQCIGDDEWGQCQGYARKGKC